MGKSIEQCNFSHFILFMFKETKECQTYCLNTSPSSQEPLFYLQQMNQIRDTAAGFKERSSAIVPEKPSNPILSPAMLQHAHRGWTTSWGRGKYTACWGRKAWRGKGKYFSLSLHKGPDSLWLIIAGEGPRRVRGWDVLLPDPPPSHLVPPH